MISLDNIWIIHGTVAYIVIVSAAPLTSLPILCNIIVDTPSLVTRPGHFSVVLAGARSVAGLGFNGAIKTNSHSD